MFEHVCVCGCAGVSVCVCSVWVDAYFRLIYCLCVNRIRKRTMQTTEWKPTKYGTSRIIVHEHFDSETSPSFEFRVDYHTKWFSTLDCHVCAVVRRSMCVMFTKGCLHMWAHAFAYICMCGSIEMTFCKCLNKGWRTSNSTQKNTNFLVIVNDETKHSRAKVALANISRKNKESYDEMRKKRKVVYVWENEWEWRVFCTYPYIVLCTEWKIEVDMDTMKYDGFENVCLSKYHK